MPAYINDPQSSPETGDAVFDQLDEPPMYKVLLHNDDYTPMEFVVMLLIQIFYKSPATAEKIMLNIHKNGIGLCGVYTHEIAETKMTQVHEYSEEYEFPLRASIEKVE